MTAMIVCALSPEARDLPKSRTAVSVCPLAAASGIRLWRRLERDFSEYKVLNRAFDHNSGFPVPRWWLNLNARLRFILVDNDANRIVDYVNLDSSAAPLDITMTRSPVRASLLTVRTISGTSGM